MKKEKRRKKRNRILSAFFICMVLVLQLPLAAAKEVSYPVAKTENGYIVIRDNGTEKLAYCWDKSLKQPDFIGDGIYYEPGVPYIDQGGVVLNKLRALLYAGYPFDAYGLSEKYCDGSPYVAYRGTQDAMWCLLGQLDLTDEQKSGYIEELLQYAELGEPQFGKLGTAEEDELVFERVGETEVYQTNAAALLGSKGEYTLNLPEGVTALDEDGNVRENATFQTGEKFALRSDDVKILSGIAEDGKLHISADYRYLYPDEFLYYSPIGKDLENPDREYQALMGFTTKENTVPVDLAAILKITVVDPPGPPVEELPDEDPPLAGPGETVPPLESIPDGDAPLAPPSTGGSFMIGLAAAVLVLSFGMLIVVSRRRKKTGRQG